MAEKSVFSHLTVADKLLITILLLVSFFSYAMIKRSFSAGVYAVVRVNNRLAARLPLKGESQKYDFQSVTGPIVVERKGGQVRMLKASCPNKICLKMGWIGNSGGIIVCAPGKVLIHVAKEKENGLDAISQ